jgi:alpha-ketoglutarate-dependent taurine dioxygenase
VREFVRDPSNQARRRLEAGECAFVPNWTVLHGRRRWQDDAEQSRRLLRVWYAGTGLKGFAASGQLADLVRAAPAGPPAA